MKAVILAGGLGKRVRPYTLFLPKPMLPLGDKPIIGHVINWIKKQNINEIIISSSYMNETIENYYGNGKKYNVKIKYVKSKKLSTIKVNPCIENEKLSPCRLLFVWFVLII